MLCSLEVNVFYCSEMMAEFTKITAHTCKLILPSTALSLVFSDKDGAVSPNVFEVLPQSVYYSNLAELFVLKLTLKEDRFAVTSRRQDSHVFSFP